MSKLRCDICGGQLEIQPDKRGLCLNCGASYSLETMREMFSGVKASATNAGNDAGQQRQLLEKYYSTGDFAEAERICKRILEASPNDAFANEKYDKLQILKYMDIRNGVLVGYSGNAEKLAMPEVITEIKPEVFKGNASIREVWLPKGIKIIPEGLFCECTRLEKISIPDTVTYIDKRAFYGCMSLTDIDIPGSVISIGDGYLGALEKCSGLKTVTLHKGLRHIGANAFRDDDKLESVELPDGLETIGEHAFSRCGSLRKINIPNSVIDLDDASLYWSKRKQIFEFCTNLEEIEYPACFDPIAFEGTKYYDVHVLPDIRRLAWRRNGRCQYCGGEIGFFSGRCKSCSRSKNY